MYEQPFGSSMTGGPKYRDNIHNFRAAVFGYALAGVIAMIIIHWVVLNSAQGHQKWLDVVGAGNTTTSTTR